jgi:hypothetical protein
MTLSGRAQSAASDLLSSGIKRKKLSLFAASQPLDITLFPNLFRIQAVS